MHYVKSGTNAYAEAAIPLASPFPTTFNIPDASHNAGGPGNAIAAVSSAMPISAVKARVRGEQPTRARTYADNPRLR